MKSCDKEDLHLKNQSMYDYICPVCNTRGEIYLEKTKIPEDECYYLHYEDIIKCDECGIIMSGKEFEEFETGKRKYVICNHCNGLGKIINNKEKQNEK